MPRSDRTFTNQQLPNDIWQAIGKLIRQLHDLQICHTDLNAHNILVQQLENEQKMLAH